MASAATFRPGTLASPWRGGDGVGGAGARGRRFRGTGGARPACRKSATTSTDVSVSSHPLTRPEIDALVDVTGLDALCEMARAVRASGPNPTVVTFSPKVFIPLTRACRDRCGYCAFAKDPTDGKPTGNDERDEPHDNENDQSSRNSSTPSAIYMSVTDVLAVAERGRAAGCAECLFTLGDRPEARYIEAANELKALGFASTVEYVAHCCAMVLEHTGLLPHVNAGVLTFDELKLIRTVSVSQGLMLESASERLVTEKGAAHWKCDTKKPDVRLRVMEHAGELNIPFTSGIMVGIGETRAERVDALFALKKIHDDGGHFLQEILVQSFRAKKHTAMEHHPEPGLDELVWTCAVARLVFGSDVCIQSPPNLTPEADDTKGDSGDGSSSSARRNGWRALLNAGVSCWGGISPGITLDFVSPEMPWPTLDELACVTQQGGFSLTPRLAVQPRFVLGKKNYEQWIDPNIAPFVRVLSDAEGFARSAGWCPGRDESVIGGSSREENFLGTTEGTTDGSVEYGDTENVSSPEKKPPPSWRAARLPRAKDLVTVNGSFSGFTGIRTGAPLVLPDEPPYGSPTGVRTQELTQERDALDSAINRLDARGCFLKNLAERGDQSLFQKLPPFDRLYENGTYQQRGGMCADLSGTASRNVTSVHHSGGSIPGDEAFAERAEDVRAAMQILSSRGNHFDKACHVADNQRKQQVGDVVTWCVNRNINYTNVCTLSCIFCAFSKGQKVDAEGFDLRGDAYLLSLDEVSRRVREAWNRGATEVCMQGGIHPEFDGETYLSLLKAAKRGAPEMHVHAFSPLEVRHGASTYKGGVSVSAYLSLLKQAGLGSLPGTAAEILSNDVRHELCPDKLDTKAWLDVVSSAHDVGIPTTSTMMFGHVDDDTIETRAAHLVAIRDAHLLSMCRKAARDGAGDGTTERRRDDSGLSQDSSGYDESDEEPLQQNYAYKGGFTEFVPLPFVHFEAPAFRNGVTKKGPTLRECLLVHAAARLVLGPAGLQNIQASWVKMGPEYAGLLLNAGCNDLGGTLMNESITRAAGAQFGQEMGPDELTSIVKNENRTPAMRTTLYKPAKRERLGVAKNAAPLLEIKPSR